MRRYVPVNTIERIKFEGNEESGRWRSEKTKGRSLHLLKLETRGICGIKYDAISAIVRRTAVGAASRETLSLVTVAPQSRSLSRFLLLLGEKLRGSRRFSRVFFSLGIWHGVALSLSRERENKSVSRIRDKERKKFRLTIKKREIKFPSCSFAPFIASSIDPSLYFCTHSLTKGFLSFPQKNFIIPRVRERAGDYFHSCFNALFLLLLLPPFFFPLSFQKSFLKGYSPYPWQEGYSFYRYPQDPFQPEINRAEL